MAGAGITSSREILDCPICLEQYHTPRSLSCLHTFCEECLNSYISSHVVNRTNFPCPVCRASIIPPNPKSPAGTWAQTFPLNNLMVTLMDGGVETKDDICCTSCRVRDDSSVKASYWCNDCCEGHCEKCYTYHQQNKFCSKHKSALIGEATVTINASADIDEDCPRHRGKILEVYCSDHSELCCVVCFATKHRECKQIHSIDDVSEEFNMDEVCSIFTYELNNIEQELLRLLLSKKVTLTRSARR
ncbi:E3 ubiquitin-protein ligase TRIM56 [Mizuhopecten yessoensis]|uniref:E3 ubiquitin-protein ligase TRIM56 n=1 Tax=Mizuhopecten yessoensis TaxID=6573 RepID=A0A210QRB9_MIZYE|nr:E3 ubiquitin-protein ligase TRIM56 [Mizuhopecten yessoensis]